MGMYDYLIIDVNKLPISEKDKLILGEKPCFQTKDFDDLMQEIYITDTNELKSLDFDTEIVPPEEREYKDPNHVLHLLGSVRRVNKRFTLLKDYNGNVNFYTLTGSEDSDTKEKKIWFEFDAEVKDGIVLNITGGRELTPQEILRLERMNKLNKLF